VIGAGFGRTGTESTKTALNLLGFHCYHMTEVIKIGRKSRLLWIKAADDPSAAEWERIFDGYDATVDWPAARFWKTLIQYYPDAKVILNVRDAEKWYDSVKNTIYKLAGSLVFKIGGKLIPNLWYMDELVRKIVWTGTFKDRFSDKSYAIEIYNFHNEEVKRIVPKDRLLVFDVKQGWEPLCRFLNLPVPDIPFPNVNDRQAVEKSFTDFKKQVFMIFTFLAVIIAALVFHFFH
ncbi:unnamed protein product, partial [Rotaria sp. Silwood1]